MNSVYSSFSKGKKDKQEIAGPAFLTSTDLISSPVKYAYMDKRPKSSCIARPALKVSSVKSSTGAGLGPGRYSARKSQVNPSFEFSRSERFDCDIFAKFRVFKTLSIDDRHKINIRVKRNKEQAVMSKEEKLEIAKKSIEKNKTRAVVARMAKHNLSLVKKMERIEKRKDKMRKFEYRMRLDVRGR